MKLVLQRARKASVTINQEIKGSIDHGLVILVGIENSDSQEDIDWLVRKTCNLRIFNDDHGNMNLNVVDINGDILLISQFTLYASTKKGNRPSYIRAAKPSFAIPIYEKLIQTFEAERQRPIQTGVFGTDMQLTLTNDGPVTIILDSKNKE